MLGGAPAASRSFSEHWRALGSPPNLQTFGLRSLKLTGCACTTFTPAQLRLQGVHPTRRRPRGALPPLAAPSPFKLADRGGPHRFRAAHGHYEASSQEGLAPCRSGGGGMAVAAQRPPGLLPLRPAGPGRPAPRAAGLPLLGGRALDVPRLEGSGAAGAGRSAGLPGVCGGQGGRGPAIAPRGSPAAPALGPLGSGHPAAHRPTSPACRLPACRCPSTPCARPAPR